MMVTMAVRGLTGAVCGLALAGLTGPEVTMARAGDPGHGIVHIVHAAGSKVNTNQSGNWSGYNIGADYPGEPTGVRFTAVSGQWTVPAATQHTAGQAEDSASWVGIGGGCVTSTCTVTDNTLIQAGTEQDVSSAGTASYDAWWEIVPDPETEISLPVSPGNQIKVTISQASLPGDWSIVIDNLTTGQAFTTTTPYPSSMDTTEWIEETPLEIGTGGTGLAAMPDLGTVGFTSATLNGATPDFQAIDEMQLVTSTGTVVATPSAPGTAGGSFTTAPGRPAAQRRNPRTAPVSSGQPPGSSRPMPRHPRSKSARMSERSLLLIHAWMPSQIPRTDGHAQLQPALDARR